MPRRTLASLPVMDPTKSSPDRPYERVVSSDEQVERITQKLGYAERQSLVNQIASIERSMEKRERGTPDDPRVLKQLYQMKMQLAHDDELAFQGDDKDWAKKELNEIESVLVKEMPSKNEMWPANGSANAISVKANALRHQQAFERKYHNQTPTAPPTGNMVLRWQELRRRLYPDDPNAHNLDNIRPDRHPGELS